MKKEKKEVIIDNCILQPFERIPETLNMGPISNQGYVQSWKLISASCSIYQALDL